MGIKGLSAFLKEKCSPLEVPISAYSYKKVAVDASIFIYRYKIIHQDKVDRAYLDLLYRLLINKVHPIFVFDGTAPREKEEERQKRKDSIDAQVVRVDRLEKDLQDYISSGTLSDELVKIWKRIGSQSILSDMIDQEPDIDELSGYIHALRSRLCKITTEDFQFLKDLLDVVNVNWIQAEGEAENLCARICRQGLVEAVLTYDTDILASGCPVMLKEVKTNTFVEVRLDQVLSDLLMDEHMFTDFCIMCGTDYNKNIPKIGPKTAYTLIQIHGSIDNLPPHIPTSVLNHVRVRELFTCKDYTEKIRYNRPLDHLKLQEWLAGRGLDYLNSKWLSIG